MNEYLPAVAVAAMTLVPALAALRLPRNPEPGHPVENGWHRKERRSQTR